MATLTNRQFVSHRKEVVDKTNAAVRRALEIMGGKAETYAKKLCPVNTGNLRSSITHRKGDDHTEIVGTAVEYAPYVEYGHHQEPGRYVPALGKRLVAEYVPGKPFLKPAIEDHKKEYEKIARQELSKI